MQFDVALLTDKGGRAANEDFCSHWDCAQGSFFVIADGAGGHHGGAVASRLAVDTVLSHFRASQDARAGAVEAAIRAANDAVVREQKASERYAQMRTTLVVLAIDPAQGHATWGHIGDSRLYCVRDGHIAAQTRDHSVVQAMVDAGYLKPDQLRMSADRNKLLGALGEQQLFEPAIQREAFTLRPGDRFLLCTDGLWEYVLENEIEQGLSAASSADPALRELQRLLLSRVTPKHDNYSALAVFCGGTAQ